MTTVQEAKTYVKENLGGGVTCPVCGQYARLYKRKINSSMAWTLMLIYDYYKQKKNLKEWLKVEDYLKTLNVPTSLRGDFQKLKYWKLLDERGDKRDDGSTRAGYYRINQLGIDFVENKIKVSKYILMYNGKLEGFSEEQTSITRCLKDAFKYEELMGEKTFKGDSILSKFSIQGMRFKKLENGNYLCLSDHTNESGSHRYFINLEKNTCVKADNPEEFCEQFNYSKSPKTCRHLEEIKKRLKVIVL